MQPTALKRISSPSRRPPAVGDAPPSILYVEDDDSTWALTERHLRGRFKIERARNSDEALNLLQRKAYNLILLDIELGVSQLDGVALCRLLRGKSDPAASKISPPSGLEGVPIVFVTAFAARYTKEELVASGADDVVTKPVDYTRLLLVSSRLLVRHVVAKDGA